MASLSDYDTTSCNDGKPPWKDPLEYITSRGGFASMEFFPRLGMPEITADQYNCVIRSWLARNKERFECILRRMSAERKDATTDAALAILADQLKKLHSDCVPTVCITTAIGIPASTERCLLPWEGRMFFLFFSLFWNGRACASPPKGAEKTRKFHSSGITAARHTRNARK